MKFVVGGCGWLGQKIGKSLVDLGHEVYGSYRREEVEREFRKQGIVGFQYSFSDSFTQLSTEITDNVDFVLITLPLQKKEQTDYYSKCIFNFVSQFDPKVKVIFTSSIGIYPNRTGEFDEAYIFSEEERRSSLFLAEEVVLNHNVNNSVILRLGGLIGENRHPIRSLSGKSIPTSGEAPLSLIHEKDIARFIHILINHFEPGVYNLVYPTQLNKKEYYTRAAQTLGFSIPNFIGTSDVERKIISEKAMKMLHFSYVFRPDDWQLFKD